MHVKHGLIYKPIISRCFHGARLDLPEFWETPLFLWPQTTSYSGLFSGWPPYVVNYIPSFAHVIRVLNELFQYDLQILHILWESWGTLCSCYPPKSQTIFEKVKSILGKVWLKVDIRQRGYDGKLHQWEITPRTSDSSSQETNVVIRSKYN